MLVELTDDRLIGCWSHFQPPIKNNNLCLLFKVT